MAKRDIISQGLADMELPDVVFVAVKKPRAREPEVRAPDAPVQEVLLEPLPLLPQAERDLIFTIGKEGRCDCGFVGVCVRVTAFNCKSVCPVYVGTRVCRGCAPRIDQEPACFLCAYASRVPRLP